MLWTGLHVLAVGGDGGDVVDVGFHGLGGAEPVQRVDDEIGVAQPAVAVVPVSRRRRRFRNRGRVGGDDRAGLHETAHFERDRRAHHRRLPFERHREIAHPGEPMLVGPVEKFPACRVDGAEERIVLAEDQVHRAGEREGDLVDDIRQRRVRRQTQDLRAADIANVVGADDDVLRRTPVVVRRPHADDDARQAGERLDAADDLRRPVLALEPLEARREIGNARLVRRSASVRIVSTIAVLRT